MGQNPTEEDVWRMLAEYSHDGDHSISNHTINWLAKQKFREIVEEQKQKWNASEDEEISKINK